MNDHHCCLNRLIQVSHPTICSSQEYHLHTFWPNSAKNSAATSLECGKTGLHYDPYLACGYLSPNCTALGRVNGYTCTPSIFSSGQYAKCQVGDTSGKFGNALPTSGLKFQQLTPLNDNQPPVAANYLVGTSRTSTFASVVFHCQKSKARLLCAKLVLVPAGQPSVCPFPKTSAEVTAQLTSDLDQRTSDLNKNKDMVMKAAIGLIILAIVIFILLIITIVLTAKLCCKKKPLVSKDTEDRPTQAIVGNY